MRWLYYLVCHFLFEHSLTFFRFTVVYLALIVVFAVHGQIAKIVHAVDEARVKQDTHLKLFGGLFKLVQSHATHAFKVEHARYLLAILRVYTAQHLHGSFEVAYPIVQTSETVSDILLKDAFSLFY